MLKKTSAKYENNAVVWTSIVKNWNINNTQSEVPETREII